ncbi:MAG: trigger factor, partial [Rhizobiaceae bacterium]
MNDLQVSVEDLDGLERRLVVQVPAIRIEQEVETRLKSVGRTAKLKGFRPGKVPPSVIRQRYGGQVRDEVLQEVLQKSYSEAITQEKIRPAGGPTIEPGTNESGKDFTYTATFEIYPEIQLKGLDKLKVDRPDVNIDSGDIDDMVATLRKQSRTWTPVERKAAEGDQLTVDFDGTLDGEPIEGGKGEQVPIVLGEGQMLPDFESNLKGLSSGDKKSFKLKFPKDYHAEELAGKKVQFDVTVGQVDEPVLPELDETFLEAFGVKDGNIEQFREEVQQNMERESESRVRAELKQQVMEQLLEANPVAIPGVLVEQEAASLRAESLRNMGITDEQQGPDAEAFRPAAERRVRLGLLIAAVVQDNGLEVDRERVKEKVDEICAPYDQPEEIKKLYF